MKKTISILLAALLLCTSMVACNEQPYTGDDDEAEGVTTTERPEKEEDKTLVGTTTTIGTTEVPDVPDVPDIPDVPDQTEDQEPPKPAYTIYEIGAYSEGLARIYTNMGYGYIDTKGEVVIEPIYRFAEAFHNGLACVKLGREYGYINSAGEVVIDIIYDNADEVFNTLARVEKDGLEQYIDVDGNVVYTVTGKEVEIGEYSNGLFWVQTKQETLSGAIYTITYYDHTGKVAFSLDGYMYIEGSSSFNEYGYAFVQNRNDGKIYMIKNNGELGYNNGFSDIEGNLVLYNSELWYADYAQKTLYKVDESIKESVASISQWDDSDLCGDDIYLCNKNSFGAFKYIFADNTNCDSVNAGGSRCDMSTILKDGKLLLNLYDISAFQGVKRFRAIGCSSVNGKTYFTVILMSSNNVLFSSVIDSEGNVLVAPTDQYVLGYELEIEPAYTRYDLFTPYSFSSGLCKAQDPSTELFGYIDLTGNWVIAPQYEKVTDFYGEGDEAVAVVNGNTVINRKGEVVMTIQVEE